MPVFDHAVYIDSAPSGILDAIQHTLSPEQQIAIPKRDRLVIVLHGECGYIYVLHPQGDDATRVRLIVDSTDAIRRAFETQSPKRALLALLEMPSYEDKQIASEARQHLRRLKRYAESAVPEPDVEAPDRGAWGLTRLERAALTAGLLAFAVTVIAVLIVVFSTRPRVSEHTGLTVTYPAVWEVQNLAGEPQCSDPARYECLLGVSDRRDGATWISIGRYPVATGITAEQARLTLKDYVISSGGQIVSESVLQIDGLPAAQVFYTLPVGGDLHYGTQIYLTAGGAAYEIVADSRSEAVFWQRLGDIDRFIQGLDFKP